MVRRNILQALVPTTRVEAKAQFIVDTLLQLPGFGTVDAVAMHPTGQFALVTTYPVAGQSNVIKIDLETYVTTVLTVIAGPARDIKWAPNGQYAILLFGPNLTYIYNVATGVFSAVNPNTVQQLYGIAFEAFTQTAILVGANGTIMATPANVANWILGITLPTSVGVPGVTNQFTSADFDATSKTFIVAGPACMCMHSYPGHTNDLRPRQGVQLKVFHIPNTTKWVFYKTATPLSATVEMFDMQNSNFTTLQTTGAICQIAVLKEVQENFQVTDEQVYLLSIDNYATGAGSNAYVDVYSTDKNKYALVKTIFGGAQSYSLINSFMWDLEYLRLFIFVGAPSLTIQPYVFLSYEELPLLVMGNPKRPMYVAQTFDKNGLPIPFQVTPMPGGPATDVHIQDPVNPLLQANVATDRFGVTRLQADVARTSHEQTQYNALAIRDVAPHISATMNNLGLDKSVFIIKNTLNQQVAIQPQGDYDPLFTNPINLIPAFNLAAGSNARQTLNDPVPYVRFVAQCAVAPAAGVLDAKSDSV